MEIELKIIDRMLIFFFQVYSCLGDSDGVEGCVGSSKLDSSARAMRYHHRGQWMEAFAIHDAVNSSFGTVVSLIVLTIALISRLFL